MNFQNIELNIITVDRRT